MRGLGGTDKLDLTTLGVWKRGSGSPRASGAATRTDGLVCEASFPVEGIRVPKHDKSLRGNSRNFTFRSLRTYFRVNLWVVVGDVI